MATFTFRLCAPVTHFACRCCLCNGGAHLLRTSMATGFRVMLCSSCGEKNSRLIGCFCLRRWNAVQRILECRRDDGCWPFHGPQLYSGYGEMSLRFRGKRIRPAHRISYFLFVGELDYDLTIDHTCGNRCCVNPDHLRQIPFIENVRAGGNARKTHCIRGHPIDGVATNGNRYCKKCARMSTTKSNRKWRAKLKARRDQMDYASS